MTDHENAKNPSNQSANSTKKHPPSTVPELIKQRGAQKGRLTLFQKYVSRYETATLSATQKAEIQLRMQSATSVFGSFNEIQYELELNANESDLAEHLEYRDNFEEMYFSSMAAAKCLFIEGEAIDSYNCNQTSLQKQNHVRLPEMKLPSFDGSYDNWLEFKNSFLTIIHRRVDLGHNEKFQYLKSSLSKSALEVISELEFTAANYEHAWELLEDRFDNDRLLVHNHVKSLFNAPMVTKESATQIRKLIDTVLRNLRALKTLKEPTDTWDTLIIHLMVSKLDDATENRWEDHKGELLSKMQGDSTYKIRLEDFLTFLRKRADKLEVVTINKNAQITKNNTSKSHSHQCKQVQQSQSYVTSYDAKNNKSAAFAKRHRNSCVMCNNRHSLYTCSNFLNLSLKDRQKFVNEKQLCNNCLRSGHSANDCYFGPCRQCQQKHNSLLHLEGGDKDSSSSAEPRAHHSATVHVPHPTNALHSTANNNSQTYVSKHDGNMLLHTVLLATALVEVADNSNNYHTVRAILDNGSEHCFISEKLSKRLNASLIQSTISVSGVGQSVTQSNKLCDITMRSKLNDYETKIKCLVLANITSSLPSSNIDPSKIIIPNNIQLADPTYYVSSEIDLLIGADKFWELLDGNRIRLANGPYLQNSKLGWLISGPLTYMKNLRIKDQVQCNFTQTIDAQLRRFWELEDFPEASGLLTSEEQKCEDLFLSTTKREIDGRFSVRVPLKESADALGDSYESAKHQFMALERKLERSPEYKQMYHDFIREYIDLGHMSKIDNYSSPHYFLPHHGVFRESSSTTKVRVVFNASSATVGSTKKSYNDIQLTGPPLQNDIFSILLRFRTHKYVACADIEKFFRQINVQEDQRNLQLIVWRENSSDPLSVYRLNTVTYGTASAPYLSIRCLKQLAQECDDEVVARVVTEDFYVDDLITGHDDSKILLENCEKTSKLLLTGCFPLRKWTLNYDVTPNESKELSIGEHCQSKTLGLGWFSSSDELHFTTKVDHTGKLTKRIMLSVISQIYDPLGLLAPAVIISKIILQKLWLSKIDWNDSVPDDVTSSWNHFVNSLQCLNKLRIPRFVKGEHTKHTDLHIFTDASQDAVGSCCYLRTFNDDSSVFVRLLCAKSKVAPLKTVSVPRLELIGAQIGAKLYKRIKESSKLKIDKVYFWTDSTIVIGWLRTSPRLLKTFVQNRVVEINNITGDSPWLHVRSKDNPADLVSRGLYLDALYDCSLWWNGPPFLQENNSNFAKYNSPYCNELPELKCLVSAKSDFESIIDFERFSNFTRLNRTAAYVLRFITNCRTIKERRMTDALSVDELNASQIMLMRIVQTQSFFDVYQNLTKNCKQNKKVSGLNVFLDENNLIRVGGRISNSEMFNYEKKHPVLLCSKHLVTKLLFRDQHMKSLHAGPQLLLAAIRECWWPLAGRNLARKIVRDCVVCARLKGKTLTPIMGNLPSSRLEPGFPFMNTGVDMAGPVLILNRKGRGATLVKSYICLFVCFATRAIHLELISGISTNDYLLALKRFTSRRGKPSVIYSDGGGCFVGSQKEIGDYATNDGIKLRFNVSWSPHQGGLWEAGVKSCKHHLRRILGNAHLTFEELSTVLAQIEAVLNSRPMSPLSTDPDDFLPLTPGHFLIGRPLTAPACKDLTDRKPERLVRYDRIEQIRQHFWERWSKEYVSELQTRTKWKTVSDDIKIDSMVLIKEDLAPPLKWKLGRIQKVYPGKDGVSRVADIRTASGVIKRAFSKICPLPIQTMTV